MRVGTAAYILLHIVVSVFVVTSFLLALHTIADTSRQIANQSHLIFAGALVAGFVPFGWIVFWGSKALAAQFYAVFSAVQKNSDRRQ